MTEKNRRWWSGRHLDTSAAGGLLDERPYREPAVFSGCRLRFKPPDVSIVIGRKRENETIAVAMSGGVDSSLAAALLVKQGCRVVGLTMRLFCPEETDGPRSCCSLDSLESARKVAAQLGIPHYVIDCRSEFKRSVIDYFVSEYEAGRTPNPCVECNRSIKFGRLLRKALDLGCSRLATGHYARIVRRRGRFLIAEAVDGHKDQSYFLWPLKQEQLSRIAFPLGRLAKKEVRERARLWGLAAAERQESQEICFIPGNDYAWFLSQRIEKTPGEIVDSQGRVLGRHRGIVHFTIGQRQGIGLAARHPLYVIEIDVRNNRIVVGRDQELWRSRLWVEGINWLMVRPSRPIRAQVRIRHRHPRAEARIRPTKEGAEVEFLKPQRAPAPGQSAVFYRRGAILGGGIIVRAE